MRRLLTNANATKTERTTQIIFNESMYMSMICSRGEPGPPVVAWILATTASASFVYLAAKFVKVGLLERFFNRRFSNMEVAMATPIVLPR